MKTNLFFVAALLFAGTAMSQSVSTSSQASSNINAKATPSTKEVSSSSTVSSKNSAKVEDYQGVSPEPKSSNRTSADAHAGSSAKVSAAHNKAEGNSSITIGEEASAKSVTEATANGLKRTDAATRKTAKASVKTANNVKTKASEAPIRPRIAASVTSRSVVSIR